MTNKKPIVTRFPPSPTGPLHVGNVRTALFNYFFARQNQGTFIVRIEDTDKARSKKEYEDNMLNNLKWLGISYDNEVLLHQSTRTPIYKKYLEKLIADGKAYVSPETEGENKEVVRFKNPNIKITFADLVRGDVTIDTTDLGDFIIARNIYEPVYHLAVVIDDFEQGITHVIRGEDHISNTPRHILIQEAIGAPRPIYAHLPLVLAPDRSKLSKRKHGEMVSLDYYKELGYLPEAIINFLGLLGFNSGNDQELFSMADFIKIFDFNKIQKGGAIFNIEKLKWFNKEYMKKLYAEGKLRPENYLAEVFRKNRTEEQIKTLFLLVFERASTLNDLKITEENPEWNFLIKNPEYEATRLLWKGESDAKQTQKHLSFVAEKLQKKGASKEELKESVMKYAEAEGKGSVLWPLRYTLSGKEKSPDPFTLLNLLGNEKSLERIQIAKTKLSSL